MRHIASGYTSLVLYEFMASQRIFNSSYDDYKKIEFLSFQLELYLMSRPFEC